ncbi:hypothetical protein FB479_111130 [Brevibacillus sp. AG162]|uniref:hypothetical protein n=1 Tax=Brevibacillus sp. AG162 TaxID=2572910 RepID=UPI0011543E8D|nr:hypothetical protein [Brevibacillus sp. AG162]TQK53310.1 hypothetical protein FB479_111130 [Brevibacillus sp. AG162]
MPKANKEITELEKLGNMLANEITSVVINESEYLVEVFAQINGYNGYKFSELGEGELKDSVLQKTACFLKNIKYATSVEKTATEVVASWILTRPINIKSLTLDQQKTIEINAKHFIGHNELLMVDDVSLMVMTDPTTYGDDYVKKHIFLPIVHNNLLGIDFEYKVEALTVS